MSALIIYKYNGDIKTEYIDYFTDIDKKYDSDIEDNVLLFYDYDTDNRIRIPIHNIIKIEIRS